MDMNGYGFINHRGTETRSRKKDRTNRIKSSVSREVILKIGLIPSFCSWPTPDAERLDNGWHRWFTEGQQLRMIDFLFSLPLWLLGIILNLWLISFGLVGLVVARRRVLPELHLRYDDAYFGAAVVQSAMLLYGLVAALTAVGVWQRHSQAAETVSGEATAIASLWRDLGSYPQLQRDQMRDILRGYTEQVINEAWPQLRRGQIPREGVEWMDRLQAQLFTFEPVTEGQKILHAETVHAFNHLVQQRRQRLDAAQTRLPTVLWWVLLPGAMGCMSLCLFFHLESIRFHIILLVGLAMFLAMVLFVIFALDRPLTGDMGIGSDSYQLIYDHHMKK